MPLKPRIGLVAAPLAALLAASSPAFPAESEPHWSLDLDGRAYTYTLTISSPLTRDVLLDVLFDPRHVAVFSKSAGRLVVLKEDGPVNEVRFDTRRMMFKCSTEFRRRLDRESGSIEIEMISFRAGWGKLAPHAKTSHATYTVSDLGSHREVVYRQVVETDKPVAGFSLRQLRKSMKEFARDLGQYLQRSDLARSGPPMPGSAGGPAGPRRQDGQGVVSSTIQVLRAGGVPE